ncbi:MAG: MFS transporter [Propionicimonas sp.]|uniref:MFS transporter n=1 Tax=Propionicimonas sp. TaxID=1955623 RepID=UPI003D0F033C
MTQGQVATPPVRRLGVLMAVYLLGIFMGAIDTGIVTPARTIIQNDLGVDDSTGIWMLTIYTLAYAASIPIMGKLADRYGRKPVYLLSITLFGVGSLLCGLSQDVGSFEMLIISRAIQAIGGGGIVPIATAEFGTSVPEEKRGMALGLVGGVYGVANIFGSSAGSLILNVFGTHNWQFIFYVNVPISIAIIVGGLLFLPNHKVEQVSKIDLLGITLLVAMILSLLYGLRNIDFFDFVHSVTSTDVYPFLLGFLVLLPFFVLAERRAADPVLNLSYFTDAAIGVTLLLAFLSGVILMGVVFVPQFAENALRIPSGDGGYFVIILGLFSGIGAPLSGTLTDRFGPRLVLGFGVTVSAIAAAVGVWWAIPSPSWVSVCTTLALMGLGLGFTIGSPLNYMMLDRTRPEESNSALATLSLVRSIGTTLAPAILVGFLSHAGTELQTNLTAELPTQISAPALPHASELQAKFAELKADEHLKDKLKDVDFPDLTSMTTIDIDMDSGASLPDDLVELLQTADVTNITERTKTVAERMFAEQTPSVIADITDGVNTGLSSLDDAASDLTTQHAKLVKAVKGVTAGITGMRKAASGMEKGIAGMTKAITGMDAGLAGTAKAKAGMEKAVAGITKGIKGLDAAIAGQKEGIAQLQAAYDQIMAALPPGTPEPPAATALREQIDALTAKLDSTKAQRTTLVHKRDTLRAKIATVTKERAALARKRATVVDKRATLRGELRTLEGKLATAVSQRHDLVTARDSLADALDDLATTRAQLVELRDAVPGAFETAKENYLAEIDALSPTLEQTFADTLNTGFRGIYLSTMSAALAAGVLLLLSGRRRTRAPRP